MPVSEGLQHPLLGPEWPVGPAGAVEVGLVLGHQDGEPRAAGDGRGPHEAPSQPLFGELVGYRDSLMCEEPFWLWIIQIYSLKDNGGEHWRTI